jgi:hypothetical protein
MSIDALNWVFRMHPSWLDGVTRSVLVVLADHADEEDRCHPSVERIQLRTSWSERGVRKALRKLEAMGLVTSQQRHRQTTRFRLNLHMDLSGPSKGACGAPLTRKSSIASEKPCDEQDSSEENKPVARKGASGAPLQDGASKGAPDVDLRGHHVPNEGAPRAPEPPVNHQRTTRGRGASARPTPLPPDWQPSEEDADYARRLGLDPVPLALRFRKTFLASGKALADWSKRWELWCDEDAAEKGTAAGVGSGSGPVAAPHQDSRKQAYVAAWLKKRDAGEDTAFSEKLMADVCPEALAEVRRIQGGTSRKPAAPHVLRSAQTQGENLFTRP